jgi:hypothetical protein
MAGASGILLRPLSNCHHPPAVRAIARIPQLAILAGGASFGSECGARGAFTAERGKSRFNLSLPIADDEETGPRLAQVSLRARRMLRCVSIWGEAVVLREEYRESTRAFYRRHFIVALRRLCGKLLLDELIRLADAVVRDRREESLGRSK